MSRTRNVIPLIRRELLQRLTAEGRQATGMRFASSVVPARRSSPLNEDMDSRIVKSRLPAVPAVVGKTLTELLWENARQYENAPAFECGVTGRLYTYADVYKYSKGFATGLRRMGLERNEMVAIILPNMPEYPIVAFGTFDAGCRVSTVNPAYTADEMKRQLVICGATTVITTEAFLPSVLSCKSHCPQLKHMVVVSPTPPLGCHSFFNLIKTPAEDHTIIRGTEIDTTNDLAFLPFSSGTTGLPKGVMITHSNLATAVRQYVQPGVCILEPCDPCANTQERLVGILPFYHAYGLSVVMVAGAYLGAHIVTLPKFEPATFITAIKRHKPTVMHLVTPLVSFLAHSEDCHSEDLKCMHTIFSAGAPVGPTLISKLMSKATSNLFFQEGFGMTETTSVTHVLDSSRRKLNKIGSCGTVIPGTISKVVDIDTGRELGPHQRGEILVKGPSVMKGYFRNEAATRQILEPDGWLHTGDIGYYDADSDFYIVDRLKELIKVKALQVAPSELENILRTHPEVADVAVVGIPDNECGEVPRAWIVRRSDISEDSIREYLKDKIAEYKQLAGGVEFVQAIPKGPSGKILRRELVKHYNVQRGVPT